MNWWAVVPLLLAAVPQTTFVLLYGLRAFGAGQWWRDEVGRALFMKAAALALVLDLFALWVIFPDEWLTVAIPVGYWLVLAGVSYQLFALVRSRRRHDNRRM